MNLPELKGQLWKRDAARPSELWKRDAARPSEVAAARPGDGAATSSLVRLRQQTLLVVHRRGKAYAYTGRTMLLNGECGDDHGRYHLLVMRPRDALRSLSALPLLAARADGLLLQAGR